MKLKIFNLVLIPAVFLLISITACPASTDVPSTYSIAVPTYAGVNQVLVLSNKWVIVVTDNLQDVLDKIDELTGGQYKQDLAAWIASETPGDHINWGARSRVLEAYPKYAAQARELAGERLLENPAYFTITSPDDSNYATGVAAARTTRLLVGVGKCKVRGAGDIQYVHYSYLEMPKPLVSGKNYVITLKNGKKVTFLYDEMRTVSRSIKTNQVGYLPSAPRKYAYLGCSLYALGPLDFSDIKRFKIVNANSGETVYEGDVTLREKNMRAPVWPNDTTTDPNTRPFLTGEDVYQMDFSDFTQEGDFFISIPGVGRSWPFRHAKDAYGEALYTTVRGLYHQRCGIAYEKPYTNWKRIKCHTDPVYESEYVAFGIGDFDVPKDYNRFDIIGATTDTTRSTANVYGGWHDAADWDKNIAHYAAVFDLLYAYELDPTKFTDNQFNLPESGNKIPDILDEAEWGIRVWTASMDDQGGVAGSVETWTHPPIDSTTVKYSFSRRARWCSLVYTAAAAQLAQLVAPYDQAKSDQYRALALKAYAYGTNPANSLGKITIHAALNRGEGAPYSFEWEEKDEYLVNYLLMAKARLYLLTQDKQYLEGTDTLLTQAKAPYKWPLRPEDFSPWFVFPYVYEKFGILTSDQAHAYAVKWLIKPADELVALLDAMPYRCTWPRYKDTGTRWGATEMRNYGRQLLIAYTLTGDKKYLDATILNNDFQMGANPMGMCWTTGMGQQYPIEIQHDVSRYDGIDDPVPGITIYGVVMVPYLYWQLRDNVWHAPLAAKSKDYVDFGTPDVPMWRRWSCHPSMTTAMCEMTIAETFSSAAFNAAMLAGGGWMPSEALRNREPKAEKDLYGYYYLP